MPCMCTNVFFVFYFFSPHLFSFGVLFLCVSINRIYFYELMLYLLYCNGMLILR